MYGLLAAVEYGDDVFYSHPIKNGLYRLNKKTNIVNYIQSFDWEPFDVQGLHKRAVRIKERIIFFPWNARKPAIYDIKKNQLSPYENEFGIRHELLFRCQAVIEQKSGVWVLGNNGERRIFKLCNGCENSRNAEDTALQKVFRDEELLLNDNVGIKCISSGEKIFYISGADHKILSYDFGSRTPKQIYFIEDGVLSALVGVDECGRIWFALRGTDGIGYLDTVSGESTILNHYPKDFRCLSSKQPFISVHFVNGKAVFIPAKSNAIVAVDMHTDSIEMVKEVRELFINYDSEKELFPFLYSYETEKEIVALINEVNGAIVIKKNDLSSWNYVSFEGLDKAYPSFLKNGGHYGRYKTDTFYGENREPQSGTVRSGTRCISKRRKAPP